jgi:hypothetical protein
MLQFVRELFIRTPPNNTALTDTVETFLAMRGYKLQTRVSSTFTIFYVESQNSYHRMAFADTLTKSISMVLGAFKCHQPSCQQVFDGSQTRDC